jgi:hypothetical protein
VRHSDTAEFIAHARTDVPALVAALRAVLDMHFLPAPPSDEDPDPYACCDLDCPCPTVRAITAVLDN